MPKQYSPAENLEHNLALGILVDEADLDLLETYRFNNNHGYAQTHTGLRLHRLVHSRMTGKPLAEYTPADAIRHNDPNRMDDRRSNLFVKTGASANQSDLNVSLRCDSTSGISGVCWRKRDEKWRVQIGYLGKYIFLGQYDTLEQAALIATALRITRSKVTCSDEPMDFATMKELLQAEALKLRSTTCP